MCRVKNDKSRRLFCNKIQLKEAACNSVKPKCRISTKYDNHCYTVELLENELNKHV